jgi:hypothetical protein
MRISLKDIKHFSKCPAYYHFTKTAQVPPRSHNLEIVEKVIKRMYDIALGTGFLVDWRNVVTLVDTEVFRDLDTSTNEGLQRGKQQAERILKFLEIFYSTVYCIDRKNTYTDLPVLAYTGRHTIYTEIPIVSTTPSILLVKDVELTSWDLYNDIEIRGMLWLLEKELSCPGDLKVMIMGPMGRYTEKNILTDSRLNARAGEKIASIADDIGRGVNYQSVTEQCYTCSFRKECVI